MFILFIFVTLFVFFLTTLGWYLGLSARWRTPLLGALVFVFIGTGCSDVPDAQEACRKAVDELGAYHAGRLPAAEYAAMTTLRKECKLLEELETLDRDDPAVRDGMEIVAKRIVKADSVLSDGAKAQRLLEEAGIEQ